MALSTFTELKAAIASWLDRDDLTDSIPDFIKLAEEEISADLAECPVMWAVSGTTTLAAGASTLSLPSGAIGVLYAKLLSPWHDEVDVVTLEELVRNTGLDTSTTGAPQAVAFRGNSSNVPTVTVWPTADQSYDFEFGYRTAVTALSDSNTTNFVLTRAPSIYLYGSLLASAAFLHADSRLLMWEAKYRKAIEGFTKLNWDGPVTLSTGLPVRAVSNIFQG